MSEYRYTGRVWRADGSVYFDPTLVTPAAPDMLAAALAYCADGFSVIPCCTPTADYGCDKCKREGYSKPGKHPLVRWTPYQTTCADEFLIRQWYKRWPGANIALIMGEVSGNRFGLDVDPRNGGDKGKLCRSFGGVLNQTWHQHTGGDGDHYVLAAPVGVIVPKRGELHGYPGINLQGEGSYIIAAPSLHYSGNRYALIEQMVQAATGEVLAVALYKPDAPIVANPNQPPSTLPAALKTALSDPDPRTDYFKRRRAEEVGRRDERVRSWLVARMSAATCGTRELTGHRLFYTLGGYVAGGLVSSAAAASILRDLESAARAVGLEDVEVSSLVDRSYPAGGRAPIYPD